MYIIGSSEPFIGSSRPGGARNRPPPPNSHYRSCRAGMPPPRGAGFIACLPA